MYVGISDLFPGMQMDRPIQEDLDTSHCCLVAIGRLQVNILLVLNLI